MPENSPSHADIYEQHLRTEIVRLNKIIQVLIKRAESHPFDYNSEFNLFQSTIELEEKVVSRTRELEALLRENEKINRALREEEYKFHSVLDQSLVGITMISNGVFQYANPKFAEISGYSVTELSRLGPLDMIPANEPFSADIMRKGLAGEFKPSSFVMELKRKDCRMITVEISSNTAIDIGGKPAFIAVWVDITERLLAESKVRALQIQLQEQAVRDPLTGLYNRLYLNESLDREITLAQRRGYCLSAVMADLDFFKAINDKYGHLAGDEALKFFASLMKQNSRNSDIICRFGGEEFFVLLPDISVDKAKERAENLRRALANLPFIFGEASFRVTASFGVAAYPEHAQNGKDLMNAADKALYSAKHLGRNQVKCFAEVSNP
jgi:diguanylate cyclase (GGDEF)-like protein/PAS domain S-box-containing protein